MWFAVGVEVGEIPEYLLLAMLENTRSLLERLGWMKGRAEKSTHKRQVEEDGTKMLLFCLAPGGEAGRHWTLIMSYQRDGDTCEYLVRYLWKCKASTSWCLCGKGSCLWWLGSCRMEMLVSSVQCHSYEVIVHKWRVAANHFTRFGVNTGDAPGQHDGGK